MEHQLPRAQTLERAAAIILGSLALVPLTDVGRIVSLIQAARPGCGAMCAAFGLIGWLFLAAALVGFGLAIAIWKGTRLGPVVGLGISVIGLAWTGSDLNRLLASGFVLADPEVVRNMGLLATFAAIALLLGVALVRRAMRLRQLQP
jgi:hypothetical protein